MNKRQIKEMAEKLDSRLWRLNNLYYIIDKEGQRVLFRPNISQERLRQEMWWRTVILKARQHGFTTFLDILALDSCLFNDNFAAGIIAHKIDDAKKIFRSKIKYPYDNLPDWIKEMRKAETTRAEELTFSNGSSISVSTSYRSGTLQYLHVSEFGKLAAKHPEKAREIITGAFEAVPKSGMICVESTAEGVHGAYADMCRQAQDLELMGRELSHLDFKFHFEPWYINKDYALEPEHLVVPSRLVDYFADLEANHGIKLTREQIAWYCRKEATLGSDMLREYPSFPEEAFKAAITGAYFSEQMRAVRIDGRITQVPHQDAYSVDTWWDIGRDTTAIWMTQTVGRWIHVIRYYENSGESLSHYAAKLREYKDKLRYAYGVHHYPHDMGVEDWGTGRRRIDLAVDYGIPGDVMPRMTDKGEGIEAVRNILSQCIFDEEGCDKGIDSLDSYRKEWDDVRGVWKERPVHDWASHGADSFQQLGLYHEFPQPRRPIHAMRVAPARKYL